MAYLEIFSYFSFKYTGLNTFYSYKAWCTSMVHPVYGGVRRYKAGTDSTKWQFIPQKSYLEIL